MAYTVFRCDNMPGTDQRTMVTSVLVRDGDGKNIAVENGTIVEIGALVPGEHDLYYATLATAASDLKKCAVLGTPEVIHDECTYKNLDDFTNEAGTKASAYKLGREGTFAVTAEGFVGGTVPTAVGVSVSLGANGKITAPAATSATVLGKVIAIDKTARYTFYAIKM